MDSLATLYRWQYKPNEAFELFQKSLIIKEKITIHSQLVLVIISWEIPTEIWMTFIKPVNTTTLLSTP